MKNNSAFPVFDSRNAGQDYECADPGMTLRDYFAAKAISGLMPRFGVTDDTLLDYAEMAYRVADAMMNARGEQ